MAFQKFHKVAEYFNKFSLHYGGTRGKNEIPPKTELVVNSLIMVTNAKTRRAHSKISKITNFLDRQLHIHESLTRKIFTLRISFNCTFAINCENKLEMNP